MNKELFDIDYKNDKMAIPKAFFNSIGDIRFPDRLIRLLKGQHVADEYHGCTFPGDIDGDEEPFEGVKLRLDEEEVIIEESSFYALLKEASSRYVAIHPEAEATIQELISNLNI